ncbi:MAG: error-prone DNA polymerase [Fimbriimonadales bacterium]|nr:MAG: error-prone DNA polymerase [Fimbriimonadales bacterium]
MDYVELRCHSAFHFLAAASLPEDLVARAARLEYDTLALGDADGVYGAPRFYRAAREAGIRPLIGCELTLRPWEANANATRRSPTHLYVLVMNRTGYRNLCRLLTQNKGKFPKGEAVLEWEELEGWTEGWICLARDALFPAPLRLAEGALHTLRRLFPGRLYLELQRHGDPAEERHNRVLCDVAAALRLPLVATNDVRYATPEMQSLYDVITCIRHRTTVDAAGWLLERNAERHLKAPGDMARMFRDFPAAVRNTRAIAEQCEFTLANLGYRFPDYPLPPGQTAQEYLRHLVYEGARKRYRTLTLKVTRQLEHELHIIGKLQLAGYFLIVWDIVRFCREQGILAQGRGSAANSAVCYSLGITAVDPVGMELLFERFLSEERGEWPDIDIDLPSGDQRERVLQYVYRRYGPHGAAMTANVITYRLRSAVREVGKALGFSLEQVDRVAKLLHRFEFRDPRDNDLPAHLRAAGLDPLAARSRLLVQLVEQIQHLPRHLGQHSGGMIIAAGRLDEIVPLEPARMPGRVVVQWDKDDCADLGIIKVDLLGLGMMAVLEEALPLVREHEGIELDLAHLPPNDPKTYAQLQQADTVGVFQVESRAQMATLPRLKPQCFYDLVVEVALIRPGPIVGQMVHPYLRRRAGREPITYPHPSLEPILRRTLGVPLFQEQLLRIAMTAAGFSGGEAEELRRAMGFKRSLERMRAIEAKLRAGMAAHGIVGQAAEDIVRSITSFALYGFPESHAASFALLAYASAYLKAHHPAAFTCALLNNWPMGFYHPATIVKDAQRHGVRVLPIDVTRSAWRCTLERRPQGNESVLCLRLGLKYVRGLRAEAGERIVSEREQHPFRSIEDFVHRCALREPELATLAELGALAAFGYTRRAALWQVAAIPQGPLYARASRAQERPARKESPLPEMQPVERTWADLRGSGITAGPHLLAYWREQLQARGFLPACALPRCAHGQLVKVAGHVIVRQRPGTAKGFCFLTLEDETGLANVVLTPKFFERHRTLLHTAPLLEVEGDLQSVDGVIHVRARRLRAFPLEATAPAPARGP